MISRFQITFEKYFKVANDANRFEFYNENLNYSRENKLKNTPSIENSSKGVIVMMIWM